MADWDRDSPQLRQNLTQLLLQIAQSAQHRDLPTAAAARQWQKSFLQGLNAPSQYVGAFRGEPGLEDVQVKVGSHFGIPPGRVGEELRHFEQTLQKLVGQLDSDLPAGKDLNTDQLAAVIDLCAWAHSEWIRIHPLANGNGRVARLWANFLALRYGLPPFIRLRPRPNFGYEEAAAAAMRGDWQAHRKRFPSHARSLPGRFLN